MVFSSFDLVLTYSGLVYFSINNCIIIRSQVPAYINNEGRKQKYNLYLLMNTKVMRNFIEHRNTYGPN